MGCCATNGVVDRQSGMAYFSPRPFKKPRDEKFYYEISVPSRPLFLTLTSALGNIDGYVTALNKECPVANAENVIATNSKLIFVNGNLVEGCEISTIAEYLNTSTLPLRLVLAHPNGLEPDEHPDLEPEIIVKMLQEDSNH